MSTGLRIAHFTVGRCNAEAANGIDKAVACLSHAQALLGHTVSIFSLTAKEPLPIRGVEVYCHDPGEAVGRKGLAARTPGLRRLTLPQSLVRDLRAWRPDLLHLHSVHIPENITLAAALRRGGVPYVVSVHGGLATVIWKRHRWRKLALKLLAERRHLEHAAFLHAISAQDAAGIRGYGLEGQVSIVPNGMERTALIETANPDVLPCRHPELPGRRVFLFLGRLDPAVKGLDLLLTAFAEVDRSTAALALVGPGRPAHQQALRRLSRRLGLDGDVVFTGPVYGQLKYDYLAGADVFVHPSRTEGGLPFSVLEAAAMGKPCLLTPAADPVGMFSRYGGGLVVAPDAESIFNGLTRFLMMDGARLQRFGANARSMIEQEFDWEPIAARMISCYETFALGRR